MDAREKENSVYLKRLIKLYIFLFKLFLRFAIYGRLPKVEASRIERLKKKLVKGQIAHRGGYPELTIEGFKNSLKHDVSVIEVDLNITSDGHLVLLHDFSVDRTSNGSGLLSEKTLSEVKRLDVGIKYRYPNSHVPTLEETIVFAKENNLFLLLDIKGTVEQTLPVLVECFRRDQWLSDHAVVTSFFPDVIYSLKVQCPHVLTALSCRSTEFSHEYPSGEPMFPSSPLKQVFASLSSKLFYHILLNWAWWVLGVALLLPSYTDVTTKRFHPQYYLDRGVAVVVWTVNRQREKEHLKKVLKLPFLTDVIP